MTLKNDLYFDIIIYLKDENNNIEPSSERVTGALHGYNIRSARMRAELEHFSPAPCPTKKRSC